MSEALENVFRQAQQLPERQQQEIVALVEQRLSDMRWEELLARPESSRFLHDLEEEADDEPGLEDLETAR